MQDPLPDAESDFLIDEYVIERVFLCTNATNDNSDDDSEIEDSIVSTLIDTCRHDGGMVAARAMACRQNAIMYVRI